MKCWNCGKTIPETAQACQFCEAPAKPGPTPEEKDAVHEILEGMPPEVFEELQAMIGQSKTAEEFVNRIFVGDCPKCGSSEVDHCENDPEIGELLVGRCYRCGQLWCTECLRLLTPDSPYCECWEEEEEFEDLEE